MIAIVDYGVGNLASMQNMFNKIGAQTIVTSNQDELAKAEKIVLPGVGAFDTCVGKLNNSGLLSILYEKIIVKKTPVLGVCVGMQLLFERSEEGILPGLGWIKGKVVKFSTKILQEGYKIPHMAWTEVKQSSQSLLFKDMYDEPHFYFVHSYHAMPEHEEDQWLTAYYGIDFTAGICRENIMGVQFHPEKSHKYGMKLLDNYVKYF